MRYKLYGLLNHSAPTHMGWNNLQIYQNQFPAGLGPLKQSVTWAVFQLYLSQYLWKSYCIWILHFVRDLIVIGVYTFNGMIRSLCKVTDSRYLLKCKKICSMRVYSLWQVGYDLKRIMHFLYESFLLQHFISIYLSCILL